ncbi:hypothetical protein ACS7SF_07090 [Ralstonia sp. 25C]|uniref:hypothetical protein n=1 Tax=Ralstonia sp. 25C TaxID=3447363 RepID=UPI003F7527DE
MSDAQAHTPHTRTPPPRTSLADLLALAALAPSSHNCQPWHVSLLDAEGRPASGSDTPIRLVISIDRRRALDALPALRTEMSISAGGFAVILLNLLRLAGWQAEAALLPAPCDVPDGSLSPLVRIELGGFHPGRVSPLLARLAAALRHRHTDRGEYGGTFDLYALARTNLLPYSLGGAADGLRWRVVQPGERYERLCAFYRRHAARDFVHRAAWRETYRHLVFSDAQSVPDGIGINIQSLFGPMPAWRRQLHRVLLHPALLAAFGPVGASARIGVHLERLIRGSPAVVVLSAAESCPLASRDVLAGEAIVRLWLAAAAQGLSLHPLSVALQHPDLRATLGRLLGCEEPLLFIARVGAPLQASGPSRRYRREPALFCSPPPAADAPVFTQ